MTSRDGAHVQTHPVPVDPDDGNFEPLMPDIGDSISV